MIKRYECCLQAQVSFKQNINGNGNENELVIFIVIFIVIVILIVILNVILNVILIEIESLDMGRSYAWHSAVCENRPRSVYNYLRSCHQTHQQDTSSLLVRVAAAADPCSI